ncbi:MAG: signal recognition particle protein, partial [Pseudomonadota bacterium]
SVTPAQQIIGIVNDSLVTMLGGTPDDDDDDDNAAISLDLRGEPPAIILMVGLQGSGKTTSSAKLGLHLQKNKTKILLASLDVARPAAQEQLAQLGAQNGLETVPIVPGQRPLDIAKRARQMARLGGYDVLILDSAGRLGIDLELMSEVASIRKAVDPNETLLVLDAMAGQDSVDVAKTFHSRLDLSGIVLTRLDGDARGGAALSMRAVTQCPIKFIGIGEKIADIAPFRPRGIANQILGMGDVVALVEKARETISEEDSARMEQKLRKGAFDLNDLSQQLGQLRKMGGMSGLMAMLPGVGKIKQQMQATNFDDRMITRQQAILSSMTPMERERPKIIHASRKKRIAAGSGTSVNDVNKILKQHQTMAKMMKKVGKMDPKTLSRALPQQFKH